MNIQEAMNMAKEANKENDAVSAFFLEQEDGLAIIAMPIEKEMHKKVHQASVLKEFIEQKGVERYWLIATSLTVQEDDVQKFLLNDLKEKIWNNPSKESVKDFLKNAMQLKNVPSQNPAARDILMIAQFDKKEGTDLATIEYVRDDKGVAQYSEPTFHERAGQTTSVWNVWNPVQFDITEDCLEE